MTLWHLFSDMATNACVTGGLRTSAYDNCVYEVNEKYGLSDASCEYVTSHCQAIYFLKEKRLATWLWCSKYNKLKSHFSCLLSGLFTHANHACRRRWNGVTIATLTPSWRHLPPSWLISLSSPPPWPISISSVLLLPLPVWRAFPLWWL